MNYFGKKNYENLNWKHQIYDIGFKSNKTKAILSKLRNFIDRKTLKSIYHPIDIIPHLFEYKIFVLRKRVLRIIYFQNHKANTSPFRESNIPKLPDKIAHGKLTLRKYFNKYLPTIFLKWFTLSIPTILIGPIYDALCGTLNYVEETQSILVLELFIWNYLFHVIICRNLIKIIFLSIITM